MVEIKLTQVLLVCSFVRIAAPTYANESCESIDGQSNAVKWPSTSTKTISAPPCVDKNKEFLFRECQNGQWGPEPTCFYIQTETPYCPERFNALERMCYIFTSNSPYPPRCPSQDVLSFEEYKFIIPSDKIVWMPIERDLNNGLGFFYWMEAGSLYKTVFTDFTTTDIDNIKDLNCVVSFGGDNMVASSCNETYSGVCAYKITDGWVYNEFCKSLFCTQKEFFNKSRCICREETPDVQSSDVEFLTLHQNNANKFFSNNCSIALQKLDNGSYIWTKSIQEINYTYWSKNVVFDETHIYGASTNEGFWILTESPLQCSLHTLNLTMKEPSLNLTLSNKILTLQIANFNYLKQVESIPVYCFTNADATTLLYRYNNLKKTSEDGTTMILEFETLTDAPGHYWCEGFKFDDSTIVKSNAVLSELTRGYFEFVILLSVYFVYGNGVDPINQNTIDYVDSTLFEIFRNDDNLQKQHTLRIIKFVSVNYENQTVILNIHSTSLKTLTEEQYDFDVVNLLIRNILLNITGIKVVDFFSASYCYKENDGGLTWPETPVGYESTPNEFCFTKDNILVRRSCDGNFIDGARWSNYEDCEILSKSKLSNSLLSILSSNTNEEKEAQVYRLSLRYSEIKPLDLYLIGEIFLTLDTSNVSVEPIAKTINNILQISNCSVFKEAQLKTKATDTILNFLGDVVMNYNGSFDIGLTNFIFTFLKTGSLSGLVVLRNNYVQVLHGNHTIDDMQQIQDIKDGVWVSPIQNESQKVSFSIFFNDNFFVESVDNPHDVRTVFGMVLSEVARVKVFHKVEYDEKVQYCLFWDQGTWIVTGKPQIYSSFAVCEYSQSGYLALSLAPRDIKNDNITDDLIDVLESNDSSETMQRLSDITESYRYFKPIDISYVGKILQKVSTEKVDLKYLAKTVSHLQKIRKSVLYESQIDEKGTDVILYYVDVILKLQEYQDDVQVFDDNFMILIVSSTNFSGIIFRDENNSTQIKILTDNSSIEDILRNDNFDSAVILDPALKNQIGRNSKIIITMFKNDTLFNERDPERLFVSKIFGVILPDVGEYSGPVSVLHNISIANTSNHCVHWNYGKSKDSFWKKDNSTKKVQFGVSQCDFWHTTHFAVLVVDARCIDLNTDTFDLLDIVVTVNSVLSVIGLSCIVFTAILFQKWRSNTGNQILLNFVIILILQIAVFYVSSTINLHSAHYLLCIAVGGVLHYCTISQFLWMLVVAFLQFRRLVVVLQAPPKKILLKSCLFAWILPLVPVIIVLVVAKDSYVRNNGLCYPSDWSLYLGVWLPVSIVVTINGAIFVKILYNVVRKKAEIVNSGNNEVIYQALLAVLLFFMFGLTWIFGFLSNFHDAQVFVYLFCCTSSLQGFVIFLFFIVCNPNTKYLYVRKCCKRRYKK